MRVLLSLILVALVLRYVDWVSILPVLKTINLRFLLIGSGLTPVMFGLLGVRWTLFLRGHGLRMPLGTTLRLTWAGQFFNSVLPGSIGGDAVKLYEVCQRFPAARMRSAGTIVVDRLCALVALGVLASIALLRDPGPISVIRFRQIPTSGIVWGVACFLLLIIAAAFALWHSDARNVLRERFAALREMLRQAAPKPCATVVAIVMSFGIHGINFYIAHLFALALGYQITYGQILLTMPVIAIVLLLPITVNGHGLREILLISYFVHFGISPTGHPDAGSREAAVALSVILVANDFLWALPGGFAYLWQSKRALSGSSLSVGAAK